MVTVDLAAARRIVNDVPDPELPMVTLADLGIVRDVTVAGTTVQVAISPTYSGCPALNEMRADIVRCLGAEGFADVDVRLVLAPPWTSDWITAEGRRKLRAAGISPPGRARGSSAAVPLTLTTGVRVACPRCGSSDTVRTAAFSGTACRSLHRCRACAEPFEHVKEI